MLQIKPDNGELRGHTDADPSPECWIASWGWQWTVSGNRYYATGVNEEKIY
jgi:hypothetical protein